jgi:hypothetical protein
MILACLEMLVGSKIINCSGRLPRFFGVPVHGMTKELHASAENG